MSHFVTLNRSLQRCTYSMLKQHKKNNYLANVANVHDVLSYPADLDSTGSAKKMAPGSTKLHRASRRRFYFGRYHLVDYTSSRVLVSAAAKENESLLFVCSGFSWNIQVHIRKKE